MCRIELTTQGHISYVINHTFINLSIMSSKGHGFHYKLPNMSYSVL